MTHESYSGSEVDRVRELQRLAYRCAEEVASTLTPGVTEREAANRLGAALLEAGATGFFHTPFAWFGDRAGFYGFPMGGWRRPWRDIFFGRELFPTDRKLEEGMCCILDVAPIRDGYCADIGYSFSCGPNPAFDEYVLDLIEIRDLILREVRAERTMREIYRAVDILLIEKGYESAHAYYPSRVLAHKIGPLPLAHLQMGSLIGFDPRAFLYLGGQMARAFLGRGRMPLWNAGSLSNALPDKGLWAFEPHIRKAGIGAKWEEAMLIGESDAHWIDDDLPHVRHARHTRAY